MDSDKENLIRSELQLLQDKDFESVFSSPWKKYPILLVKDELIRRLKLRTDLSDEERRVRFGKIMNDARMYQNNHAFEKFLEENSQLDLGAGKDFLAKIKTQIEEDLKSSQQLSEIRRAKGDPFEGKSKPGDWGPDGTETCPVCSGYGKGSGGRICSKCNGRGFTRK